MGSSSPSNLDQESRLLPFGKSIEESFERFHEDNPEVLDLLIKYSRQVKARGFQHYSMDAIYHRVRWHYNIETHRDPNDEFKLNNNFTSRYARMIMEMCPDLKGFFETRVLKSS